MAKESFQVSATIPASPEAVYEAWLDSEKHSAMTGGRAHVDPRPGGRFKAWDDYITGETIALVPCERVVQSWRTQEFPPDADDSMIEVRFEPEGVNTRITIVHTDIPAGQGEAYERGWHQHYFEPMATFFRDHPEHARQVEAGPAVAPREVVDVVEESGWELKDINGVQASIGVETPNLEEHASAPHAGDHDEPIIEESPPTQPADMLDLLKPGPKKAGARALEAPRAKKPKAPTKRAAKKTATKKHAVKKSASKKSAAKKSAGKKPAPKKSAAKKSVAKKSGASKKASKKRRAAKPSKKASKKKRA